MISQSVLLAQLLVINNKGTSTSSRTTGTKLSNHNGWGSSLNRFPLESEEGRLPLSRLRPCCFRVCFLWLGAIGRRLACLLGGSVVGWHALFCWRACTGCLLAGSDGSLTYFLSFAGRAMSTNMLSFCFAGELHTGCFSIPLFCPLWLGSVRWTAEERRYFCLCFILISSKLIFVLHMQRSRIRLLRYYVKGFFLSQQYKSEHLLFNWILIKILFGSFIWNISINVNPN